MNIRSYFLAGSVITGAAVLSLGVARAPARIDPAREDGPKTAGEHAARAAALNPATAMHEMMSSWAGEWDVTMTMWPMGAEEPVTLKARATRELILGRRFLRDRIIMPDGVPGESESTMGFNADAQNGPRFEVVRLSSMLSCQMPETGTYDATTRTLTLRGEHEANGMRGRIRNVIVLESNDRHTVTTHLSFEGYSEKFKGAVVPEHKAMEMAWERVKAR